MNESTKELIAIGASVGAHCTPCLEYHIKAALGLGVNPDEIHKAIEIGHKVEKGAMAAMKKVIEQAVAGLGSVSPMDETAIELGSARPATPKVLKIYDPAMCCSSGVCGPSVDPILARFTGTLNAISRLGTVVVERYNLSQQPQVFVDNGKVKALLAEGGVERLPYIFIDDELAFQARYPERDELAGALGITIAATPGLGLTTVTGNPCCGEGGGCC